MRSGNGRHRRPRQAPAIIVAAGVTGSALALPLLGAGSASAADAATWDRVAECESGGLWSADFGNGLYGGLQFTQETWETYGGTAYASRADLASRSQQIAVAEKALAAQGTQIWATCAPIAKLTNDGAAPEVDPGMSPAPTTPTAPAAQAKPDAAKPAGPAGTAATPGAPSTSTTPETPDASVTPGTSDSTGDPGSVAGEAAGPGNGKHRGEAAREEGNAGEGQETGRHASPADGQPGGSAGEAGSEESGTTDTSGEYTVQPGDSLSEIARENELPGGWTALYDANRQTVGADPNLILPGQSLDLSEEPVETQG
ncbi:transglycosylase family protein [Streptomyces sp. NPDC006464]|uniref:transglycosylase family protein n=1 Tax=Streptomyces sp. NPDC006464 TaxID=3154305 RepID=UPI00339F3D16